MELAEIWRNELHRMALWLQQGGILEPLPSEEFRGRMNMCSKAGRIYQMAALQ